VPLQQTRAFRSAVERELIKIGEAIGVLGRVAPAVVDGISHAYMIVGFRNVLAHDDAAAPPMSPRRWYHRQYSRRYHT